VCVPGALPQGLKSVRENSSFAPPGLVPFQLLPQGLRHGLHSVAASRLKSVAEFHSNLQQLVLRTPRKLFH
jgi:hypothetical protein